MRYVYLIIAIVFEVVATTLLGLSEGFTKMLPAALSLALYAVSFITLSKALMEIDLGVAYATWCSIGMILTSVIAVAFLGQRLNAIGVASMFLIIAGCVTLNLFGTSGN